MQAEVSSRQIVRAEFRLAKEKEKREGHGSIAWQLVSAPWWFICKVAGTFELYKKTNLLDWDTPFVQAWGERTAARLGYPSDFFIKRIYTYLLGNRHFLEGNTKIFEAFFAHHRNNDLFSNSVSMLKLLEIVRQVFPKDNFSEEDFIMTCSKERTEVYHHSILPKLLSGINVRKFIPQIELIAAETLEKWEAGKMEVNVTEQTRLFASRVIAKLMFDEDSQNQQIPAAIDFINSFIIKSLLRQVTKEDQERFIEAKKTFRKAVHAIMKGKDVPIIEKSKNSLSVSQQKALIFLLFFAGQETTASLLTYVIRMLALNKDLQDELYKSLSTDSDSTADRIKDLFRKAIREFTPAFGVARIVEEDAILKYWLYGETKARKVFFPKGDIVVARISKAAETSEDSSYRNWKPFGDGPNRCPGEKLAVEEIVQFVKVLVLNYVIETDQIEEIQKVGHVTLKLKEDVKITIKPRV